MAHGPLVFLNCHVTDFKLYFEESLIRLSEPKDQERFSGQNLFNCLSSLSLASSSQAFNKHWPKVFLCVQQFNLFKGKS